jgi:hypothetical protein
MPIPNTHWNHQNGPNDDLGHLRAYELTYGEQIRDLTL